MSSTAAVIQVSEFIRALALSWKNLAAYPTGHPALDSSLDLVRRRFTELRGPAGEVVLGITTAGVIYGSDKIESTAAMKFAQALYSRGVATIRLSNDTTVSDLETFLRLLASGRPSDQKSPIWEDLTAAGVVNINLQPVSYSHIQVTDRLDESRNEQKNRSLWEDILRGLLQNRQFSNTGTLRQHVESADELARLIAQYFEAPTTFDPDATFGIRIPEREDPDLFHTFLDRTVGEHITAATGLKKQHSLQQAIELIRSLPEPLRQTLLRTVAHALASDETAGALLRELASELPTDEVLEALRYLSATGKLSSHAMGLLEALTTIEASSRTEVKSSTVIDELVSVFTSDDIDRFNPVDHQAVLATAAIMIPHVSAAAVTSMQLLGQRLDTIGHTAIQQQLGSVLFDLIADLGPEQTPQPVLKRLEELIQSYVSAGQFRESVELIERLQDIRQSTNSEALKQAIDTSLSHLVSGELIQALVDRVQSADKDELHGLIKALGEAARRSLLVALAEENNRSKRRRLFDFIASLGPTIVKDVISFLNDTRWYVLRNMILLLRSLQDRTSLPQLRTLARHADLRVRMEAIKSLFAFDATVSSSLLDDLFKDPDAKVAETAVALVGNYGIKEGVIPLLRILEGNDLFGARRSLRVKALRALGELGDARALSHIERFFTLSKLPWPSRQERHIAWESLAHYPPEVRESLVHRGLRSSDARVRAICAQFAARP